MDVKEAYFSENCYGAISWPFSDQSSEGPTYNPLIDLTFKDRSTQIGDDELPFSLIYKKVQLYNIVREHEAFHSQFFDVTSRGMMQIIASHIYAILDKLPEKLENPLHIPSLDNFRPLRDLRLALDTLYESTEELEEIFAFYDQLYFLNVLYEDSELPYRLDRSPDGLSENFLENTTELDEESKDLAKRYNNIVHFLGDHRYLLHHYSLNLPIPKDALMWEPCGNKSDSLGHLTQFARGVASKVQKYTSGPRFSPKKRFARAISVIEDFSHQDMRNWSQDRFLSLFKGSIPNFKERCFSYREEFIPFFKTLYGGILDSTPPDHLKPLKAMGILMTKKWMKYEKFDYKNLLGSLITRYAQLKDRVEELGKPELFDKNGTNRMKASSEEKSHKKADAMLYPSAYSFDPATCTFVKGISPDAGDWPCFYTLLRAEDFRQQIFRGKGLTCPPKRFSPMDCENRSNSQSCPFKPTLKGIWNNTKPDPEAEEWTKPKCL